MEKLWKELTEDQKEEFGYRFGNETADSGYWKDLFHALGKGKEHDAFLEAFEEIMEVIPGEYIG